MAVLRDQRVGIFVDVQNLYHSAKNLYNAKVNFSVLCKHLAGGRKLIKSIAYVVQSEVDVERPSADQKERPMSSEASFFVALKEAGFELRLKDLQVYHGGFKKADWDVGMAVDAIRMADSYDSVVLATGDGDFVPLVEYLKWGLGKEVSIAAFSKTASQKLKESAEKFIPIEEIQKVLLKK